MNDKVIDLLVQLFAVVASVRGSSDMSERRIVVYKFLERELNNELANKFITQFDIAYRNAIEQNKRSDNQYKVISRVSTKVTRIAYNINRSLTQLQKYTIVIQLYEYLNTGHFSYIEQGLIDDVIVDKFNLNQKDIDTIRSFILNSDAVIERTVISGNANCESIVSPRHFYWEDLKGEISYVYLVSASIFLFKFKGEDLLTFNNQQVNEGHVYIMRTGNTIRPSVAASLYYNDMMRRMPSLNEHIPITLEARNVVYHHSPGVIGLHSFSFESHSGQMVGVMGISGSGKSTMCNVIAGLSNPSEGHIYINNIDIHENPEMVKGSIGYVTQDDSLIEDLTVYENLYYSARLSFDNLPLPVIVDKVNNILQQLGLFDIRNVKVGSVLNKKISGGQRKRLNIALELIREPALLILDEPTSGLSSLDAESLIVMLKDLTIKGKLIFVVIHQPSSNIFKMFDQLLVLDTGGYLIYDGNPIESVSYFKLNLNMGTSKETECKRCGNVNVEQILDMISQPIIDEYGNTTQIRKITPKEWYDKFNWGFIDIAYVGDPEPLPPITFHTPNKFKQIYLYFIRDVKAKLANLQYILINLLETPLIAIMLSLLLRYYNIENQQGYVYCDNPNISVYIIIGVIVAFFLGLTVSAEEIIQDRAIVKREKFLNLSHFSYIMSKCVLTSIISALQMIIFVLVGNSILKIHGMTIDYWLVLFATAVAANLIGLILSDTMKKTINIYIIIPFMVIPQLILSGVFVRFDKMNPDTSSVTSVPTYGQIITARWAFEALAVDQFIYNEYEEKFYTYDKAESQSAYYKDFWVPTMRNYLNRADKCQRNNDNDGLEAIMGLIHDEIFAIEHEFPSVTLPSQDLFKPEYYCAAIHDNIDQYLEHVRRYHVQRFNKVFQAEDNFRKSMSADELELIRQTCYNKSLEDFLCAKDANQSNIIVEYNGRLWQKNDVVFQDTDKSFYAPIFSPYKMVFGVKVDTYLFDLIVMWIENAILFVVLLFGLVNKTGSLFKYLFTRIVATIEHFQVSIPNQIH